MATYNTGDRVRTTIDTPGLEDGDYAPPANTPGTITDVHTHGGYGVLLDTDPDQLSAHYTADELKPA